MYLSENHVTQLATKFTELAIENDLISKRSTGAETAKEVASFFHTIANEIQKESEQR